MSISILLDNYGGACYPGQTIAGRIECIFNKPKNLRAIRIKFKGRAETEWYESKSHYNSSTKKNETRRVRYSAEETYFEQEYVLAEGGDNFMLPQGKHVYPFSYIFPQQLPSSFEGNYGNVRYTIKGVVDRPWKFDYETKIQLNFLSPVDLNYLPGLRDPLQTSVDKDLCCCWCKSGPITFDISLPVRGYCPGQHVDIGAYVQNLSNVSAENVKFKIYKNVEFVSHYPSTHHRYEEYVVTECCEGGIGAHGEKSWTSTLVIPINDTYPNLIPCSIINITYHIKGKVVLPCPHSNLDVEFPCMIGNVPLTGAEHVSLGPSNTEMPLPSYNSIPMSYPLSSTLENLSSNYPPYPIGNGNVAPDDLPYPSTSHPPNSSAPEFSSVSGSVYPPTIAPYPTSNVGEKAPYPSGPGSFSPPTASAPYPSTGSSYPMGGGLSTPFDATAPPSYDEAKHLTEKK